MARQLRSITNIVSTEPERLTILYTGKRSDNGREAEGIVFDKVVPPELIQALQQYGDRLAAEKLALEVELTQYPE